MRTRLVVAALLALLAAPAARADGPVHSFTETRWIDGRAVEVEVHGDPPTPVVGDLAAAARAYGLPTTWCGPANESDDTAHEVEPGLPKIKVVEAVPSDRQPSATHRDEIQASVAGMVAHMAHESGGVRSLRFDLATACGHEYVDILTMRLPKTAAQYGAGACNTGPLFGDVQPRLPKAAGIRNAIIYAPTVDCGGIAGYAQAPGDDQPGPGNAANRGGYLAATFYTDGRTALHEIGHNLGAVQLTAPHTDGGRHCWDVDDTLCYPYFTLLPQSPLRPCEVDSNVPEPFDCGKDDYFSPAPAAGSYLATHWNTFNSVFMCEVAACVPEPPAPAPAAAQPPPAGAGPPPAPPAEPQPAGGGEQSAPPAAAEPAPQAAKRPVKRKRCRAGYRRDARTKRCVRRPRCRTAKERRSKRCRAAARQRRR